jgi:hypothetical protein
VVGGVLAAKRRATVALSQLLRRARAVLYCR